jgi:RNA polymerase sigma-70 factor (ECF subfamily)
MTDDQLLVQRVRHDPDAFRELYRRYFPRVYAFVAYRVRLAQDAEDITAEVFMRVVNGLERFENRGEGAFAAWVFRIAHNQVSQFYRRHPTDAVSLDDLPEIQAHHLAPDNALLRKEQFARLSTLIAELPPRRRDILLLKFFGGLRNQEIAHMLTLDERTVASHLSRALDDLRRLYHEEPRYD